MVDLRESAADLRAQASPRVTSVAAIVDAAAIGIAIAIGIGIATTADVADVAIATAAVDSGTSDSGGPRSPSSGDAGGTPRPHGAGAVG